MPVRLISTLAGLLFLASTVNAVAPPCLSAHSAIERQLRTPISVSFNNVPLNTVLDNIRDCSGINIVPDMVALLDEGVSLEAPITIKLGKVSLKTALNLILRQVGLTYAIKDEVIVATTRAAARGKLLTVSYPVDDLVGGPESMPTEKLIKRVGSISPNSWSEAGGPGTIDYYPLTMSLVINQTADVQEQVQELLATLRREEEKKVETGCTRQRRCTDR